VDTRRLDLLRRDPAVVAGSSGTGLAQQTDVSFDVHDPSWDEFVRNHAGHYKQSSAWADVKGAFGWNVARLTVTREDKIAGGAQVLLRRLPAGRKLAFAPGAPVLPRGDPELLDEVLDGLDRLARRCGAIVLMVHPPHDDTAVLAALASRGYTATPLEMAPSATSLVDLRRSEEAIFSGMRKKTRQHIRHGMRAGVAIMEGDQNDLATAYRLHVETARRKGLPPVYPQLYFSKLWDAFKPVGSPRIFLAKYNGEVLSALYCLGFGDTVSTMVVAWSGRHADLRPNELLHWAALRRAKQMGYSSWDFSSIESSAATAILDGRSLPEEVRRSTDFFKLGFGGDVLCLPSTYERVFNPFLRLVYGATVSKLLRSKALQRQIYRLRFRGMPAISLLLTFVLEGI
jgi:lipid II:glycine glycyltransferase (peptidoglycan interpeptide bridge formation enzyme)